MFQSEFGSFQFFKVHRF